MSLSLSEEEAREAVRAAGLAQRWKIASEIPGAVTFKESRKWTGSTHPVTVTSKIVPSDEGCQVAVRGKVGGVGPIQSKHVRQQVEQFIAHLDRVGTSGGPSAVGGAAMAGADPGLQGRLSHLNRRVLDYLNENLREGETIKAVVIGSSGQTIVGTDSRLFVVKPGWLAGATRGVEATSWSYRNIVGIQTHKGLVTGAVIVQAPGQSGSSTDFWGKDKSDPFKAPNAIPIGAGQWDLVRREVARLQELMDDAHAPATPVTHAPAAPPSGSVAAEIRALADLHATGALTDEEFAAAKRSIIGT